MSTSISTSSMKGSGSSGEPQSPLSPDFYSIYFSHGTVSLSQRTDPLILKYLLLADKVEKLTQVVAKLNEKTAFVFNYLTQHPGDHFYFCSKCQKWRSIFIDKQIKRIKASSGHPNLFNLYCPSCDKSCQFGPNKDIKVA